ncbi:hypothetical protein [Actinoplanes sp. NPDC051494]|uniref:hypothetical protein n=1 Tax=Actinoplanes sp. NPDC051494 TaxID=3363907 RepID=UPI003797D5BE
MPVEQQQVVTEVRPATEQWRRLPERARPEQLTETVPQSPPSPHAVYTGDPETAG